LHGSVDNAQRLSDFVCGAMYGQAPPGSTEAQMTADEKNIIGQLKDNVWQSGRRTLSDDKAWQVVLGAEWHFCPQYS
jgi:hypothetical protein